MPNISDFEKALFGCRLAKASGGIRSLSCAVGFMIVLTPAICLGQSAVGGTMTGHVRGPGGVSVPGATVQVTELKTGERKVTWTDEAGNYTLAGISPGTYRLETSLVGFRTDVRQPVPVTSDRVLKVNVALVLALPEEQASVAKPDRSGSPSGSSNFQNLPEEIRARLRNLGTEGNLPASTMGGEDTNIRVPDASAVSGTPQGEVPSVEGDPSASAANSFLLSGGVGRGAPTPGDEEGRWRQRIEEFRRSREMSDVPGFGGPAGAGGPMGPGMQQAVVFLAGGGGDWARRRAQINRVRGSVSEEYSNSALNARPYPLNVPQSSQIASYREQFGVTIGGPLVIPKIYQGRDKTSFFVHYNLSRSRNPFDSFSTVPTVAERAGDFSQAVISSGPLAGTVPTLFDPGSGGRGGTRSPFPNNQIPAAKFDPAAAGLLNFVPLPNLPGGVQNFHLQRALPSDNDRFMVRIGHQFSRKDSLNVFYFLNSSRSDSVSNFPGLTRHSSLRGQNVNLSETHTFGPQLVNTLMLNFNRNRISTRNPFAFRRDISGELGVQGVSSDPRDWGLPIVQYTNFTGLNDVIPSLTRNQTFRAFEMAIWNRGKHNVRFGGEVRRVQLNTLTDPDARGTFTFSGFTTSDFTREGFPVPGTGFDFADFLLGLPQATSVRFGTSANYFRSWVYSTFVEDDWRASSRWTLNFGLRYEILEPFTEKYGHLSNLVFGEGFSSATVVTGQSPGTFPRSLVRSDLNNLAPRVGLAFRPWTQHKLVLRAGYSVFHDGSIYQRLVPNLANQPPFAQASTLLTTPLRVLTLEQGFPEVAPGVARNTFAVNPDFRTPYAQTWNFGIEDEVARDLILSVGYVGTKGTKLDLLLAPNRAAPGSPLTTQDRLQLSSALQFTYETSGAASIYHGLQVALRRQFHRGFSMSGNYTFSKSIDDAASVGGAGRTVAQDNLDLRAERGLSVFDVRHRLMVHHSYEFPFGERKRYLSHGGGPARVFGNWQIGGTTMLQSGTPFTARVLGNLSNNSGTGSSFSERADASGLPVGLPGFEQTTVRYFDTQAFTLPAPGRFGNAGRNTIPGPRTINFDMSLGKSVTISREKSVRADFRVEAHNVFNTPSFDRLATVVNAQDFGRVTGVKSMRSLNFSMRLRF